MHMDNNQVWFLARTVEDPSTGKLGDIIPVGFGDKIMLNDELAEEGGGRRWDDQEGWVDGGC